MGAITANDVLAYALRGPGGPGHTYEFVLTPTAPGDHAFTALRAADAAFAERSTVVPIRVRAP